MQWASKHQVANPPVIIAGSFPSGRARLGVINSVLMSITSQLVELWVYPLLDVQKHDRDFHFNLYPEPKVFFFGVRK